MLVNQEFFSEHIQALIRFVTAVTSSISTTESHLVAGICNFFRQEAGGFSGPRRLIDFVMCSPLKQVSKTV